MSELTLNTIADVEQYAAGLGMVLSPAEKAKIKAMQAAELERLQATSPAAAQTFADRWNHFYPRLLETILTVGETVLTFAQTVITALGVPVVLVLLLIVEHHRVVEGILLFDQNPTFAGFAALALVMLNLVLEFQTHYIEHKAGYIESRATRWSLRIFAQNMKYRLGLGDTWTVQELSPAARYKGLLRLVTFTILALALVGSMRVVIAGTSGTWYEALVSIVTDSNLLLMMTWTGGLLFAAAAVTSAQGLSRYVAIRTVEITAAMETTRRITESPFAEEVERAGAVAAMAFINARIEKQRAKVAPVQRIQTGAAAPEASPAAVSSFDLDRFPASEDDTEPVNPTEARNGSGQH